MKPIDIESSLPIAAEGHRVVFAEDQPEYNPLPAISFPGPERCVTTRWQLTWRERLRVLFGSGIYLSLLTFNQPLQPMKLGTKFEEVL